MAADARRTPETSKQADNLHCGNSAVDCLGWTNLRCDNNLCTGDHR